VTPSGVVYSFTVTHTPFVPGFEDDLPIILVLVDLDVQRGLRIPTVLRNCDRADAHVGMRVDIVFDDVANEVSLPIAVPAQPATGAHE
jgi:uncharacterized OB-fold protein